MGKILGVLIFVAIVYMTLSWKGSISDIRDVCDFSTVGKPIVDVIDKIANFDSLKYSNFKSGENKQILVHSSASFGRHTCSIEHRHNKVVTSDYLFND